MSALRVIGYIAAGILILFGVLFILGSGGAGGGGFGWIMIGMVLGAMGFGLIILASWKSGKEAASAPQQVVMKVELPGEMKAEQMKCKSCGGVITSNDIKIMAGAPVVTCPYCQSTYQLTEEPKW